MVYRWTKIRQSLDESSPTVALIESLKGDVARRSAERIVWQELDLKEVLHDGELIHTTENGFARLHFPESDQTLELLPNSLISIQRQDGQINLDLVEGSISAGKKSGEGKYKLFIKGKDGLVDLSKSTGILSKSEGKIIADSQTEIQISSPALDQNLYFDSEKRTPILIQWKLGPTAQKGTDHFQILTGSSPEKLSAVAEVKANISQASLNLEAGRYFLKIAALDAKNKILGQSSIQSFQWSARHPPHLLNPRPGEVVLISASAKDKNPELIYFRWQTSQGSQKMKVEWATDPDFKTGYLSQEIVGVDTVQRNFAPGKYYWRVRDLPQNTDQWFTSQTQSFEVSLIAQQLRDIPWSSQTLSKKEFPKSELGLAWNADPQIQSWTVYVWPKSMGSEVPKENLYPSQTKSNSIQISGPGLGAHWAQVEGLDSKGQVIAKSKTIPFEIIADRTDQPIEIVPKQGDLTADLSGRLKIHWNTVNHAQFYKILVKSKDGSIVKKFKAESPDLEIPHMLPGQYSLEVNAVDSLGLQVGVSDKRNVSVDEASDLPPPAIKKIQVH